MKAPGFARESRSASPARTHRRRALSKDEAEYRLFVAAAGLAIVLLAGLVIALVRQLP